MRTIHEVSKLTGLSVRALHYYDQIGLLTPAQVTDAGYRLYDDVSLARLQSILLFRELKFPLKDIAAMLNSPLFDRNKALRQQIEMLKLQQEQTAQLIALAESIIQEESNMDFSAFDASKQEAYARQAKASWGNTEAYREYEQRSVQRSAEQEQQLGSDLMTLFAEMGTLRHLQPDNERVQLQVERIRAFITEHYYNCTIPILRGLGQMYLTDDFRANIDNAGGAGTAELTAAAIEIYCK